MASTVHRPPSTVHRPPPALSAVEGSTVYRPSPNMRNLQPQVATLLPAALAGERKLVTVLFADISGFTALAERTDPETIRDLLNACFDRLVPIIEGYGGTIDKFIGDAVMALFGAPSAHENDAERALLAALDLLPAIGAFNTEHATSLGMHIGVNTGLVVVGGIGSRGRQHYSAIGDAVNLAARLEDASERGEILVGPDTFRQTAPLFRFDAPRLLTIKGKAAPVQVYRLRERRLQPERLRGIAGLYAPLIGRAHELALLRRAIVALHERQGRIVCLIGEAGLGKSRLLAEAHTASLAAGDVQGIIWLEAQRSDNHQGRPLGRFRRLMHQVCDLDTGAPPDQVRATLAALLPDDSPAAHGRAALEYLLLDTPGVPAPSGEAFRNELAEAARQIWRRRCALAPTVVVLDDLHWSDPDSIELIQALLPLVDELPLTLIGAFRPDHASPAWALHEFVARHYPTRALFIELGPLSEAESSLFIDHLLSIAELPDALRLEILRRAEGNPFFVEEVVRELIERGVVVRDQSRGIWLAGSATGHPSVPPTLQALLAARIDRLGPQERALLQVAAVIGRSFTLRVLALLVSPGLDLIEALAALTQAGLIEPVAADEPTYRFRHHLSHEVAYESLLQRRRRELHLLVGETIERLTNGSEAAAPLLAGHFERAGDEARALHYARIAGDAAARVYANAGAVSAYRQAIALARRNPGIAPELLIVLYTRCGRALELCSRHHEALELYEQLAAEGSERGDRRIELAALRARIPLHATPTPLFDLELALPLTGRALALARELGDEAAEAGVLWSMLLAYSFRGDADEAVRYGEQSLAISRRLGLREQTAFTLNDLGRIYIAVRGIAPARAALEEARVLWQELDNPPMLTDSLVNLAVVYYVAGENELAIACAEEGYRISARIGNLWGQVYAHGRSGLAYLDRGAIDHALAAMGESLALSRQIQQRFAQAIVAADLAWLYASLGDVERAMAMAGDLLNDGRRLTIGLRAWPLGVVARIYVAGGRFDEARMVIEECYRQGDLRYLSSFGSLMVPLADAEMAIAGGAPEHAVALLDGLIAVANDHGVRQHIADLLTCKARALILLGRTSEAEQALHKAIGFAETIGSQRSLWPALGLFARLVAARGDTAAAVQAHNRATTTVAAIAATISDQALKVAFQTLAASLLSPFVV